MARLSEHITALFVFTLSASGIIASLYATAQDGVPTYNGIILPGDWPPNKASFGLESSVPPYLEHPPEVVFVNVGRQLFVDDFLIDNTTMTREFHLPRYHPGNPVLKGDRPWEQTGHGDRQGPMAMPFSGGVWFDPADSLFKMWYFADYRDRHLCYAVSQDGMHWEKPSLDVVPGTNIVFPNAAGASVVWLDLEEREPGRRYKLILSRADPEALETGTAWSGSLCSMRVHFSPDGIHWGGETARTGPCGDRNSAFWNPFRRQWVFSIRHYSACVEGVAHAVRCRKYWESPDLVRNTLWKPLEPVLWTAADALDASRPPGALATELYNLDAVAYESVLLGLFAIQRAVADTAHYRPKINEVCVGFSRDGFHWFRPDRRSFLPVSDNSQDWNWGNVQSVGGVCLVVGGELYFYASGRRGDPPFFCDAGGSTGLAILRRDGFASMNAAEETATLTTRPLRFSGRHLFVNVSAEEGELRAEMVGSDGNAIAPFTYADCIPVRQDTTSTEIRWNNADGLSSLPETPVRIRFRLRQGKLYSFWTSPDSSGASRGYVAAGGPGFISAIDTQGASPAYR